MNRAKEELVVSLPSVKPKVLEFFAGIGLARMGLEKAGFQVVWSNDYEADKKALYEGHFGTDESDDHYLMPLVMGALDNPQVTELEAVNV